MGGPAWVIAVNLIIWTGLVLWLFRLDRKIGELERKS
jgi:CcmD family protein